MAWTGLRRWREESWTARLGPGQATGRRANIDTGGSRVKRAWGQRSGVQFSICQAEESVSSPEINILFHLVWVGGIHLGIDII